MRRSHREPPTNPADRRHQSLSLWHLYRPRYCLFTQEVALVMWCWSGGLTCAPALRLRGVSHIQLCDFRVRVLLPRHPKQPQSKVVLVLFMLHYSVYWCFELVDVPEDSVGGVSSVSDVIKEDFKLKIVVKVGSDDGANGWRSGEGLCGDVLQQHSRLIHFYRFI